MILHVALPLIALIAIAAALPHLLLRRMPETFPGVILNALICALILTLLAAAYFFAAYLARNTAILDLVGISPGSTLLYFLRLGLGSALVWGPVLVLSVSYTPSRWKDNRW